MRSSTLRPPCVGTLLLMAMVCAQMLAGCSSISGLEGTSQYACKAPEGVKCDSVSGNYYNALQNNLPVQRKPAGTVNPSALADPQGDMPPQGPSRPSPPAVRTSAPTAANPASNSVASPVEGSPYLAAPLRAGPLVLRLWIKPWEDADRDLNGESLVYVQVDNGRWLVDHVQRQAREPYAPIRPARLPTSAAKGSGTDAREADGRQASQQDSPPNNETSAITQALRALQARQVPKPGN